MCIIYTYKNYVSERVGEIYQTVKYLLWNYVPNIHVKTGVMAIHICDIVGWVGSRQKQVVPGVL